MKGVGGLLRSFLLLVVGTVLATVFVPIAAAQSENPVHIILRLDIDGMKIDELIRSQIDPLFVDVEQVGDELLAAHGNATAKILELGLEEKYMQGDPVAIAVYRDTMTALGWPPEKINATSWWAEKRGEERNQMITQLSEQFVAPVRESVITGLAKDVYFEWSAFGTIAG